jgi:hypothetical protein
MEMASSVKGSRWEAAGPDGEVTYCTKSTQLMILLIDLVVLSQLEL